MLRFRAFMLLSVEGATILSCFLSLDVPMTWPPIGLLSHAIDMDYWVHSY